MKEDGEEIIETEGLRTHEEEAGATLPQEVRKRGRKPKEGNIAEAPARPRVHLVFGESDIYTLRTAMELDPTMEGDVLIIRDDFAVGPIVALETEEGWDARAQWWRRLWLRSPYSSAPFPDFDDRLTVVDMCKRMEEEPDLELWVWCGQNAHDVCGYYWLVAQLADFAGRIMILYLNNLPFINEKGGIFYPRHLHEIAPVEFRKAKKLARAVTGSEFELDPEEWRRLTAEDAGVRILEGGKKIVSAADDFYDRWLLDAIGNGGVKGSRIIANTLSKATHKTGDLFLLSRLLQLEDEGKLRILGDPKLGWKEFTVNLPAAEALPDTDSES